MPILSVRTMGSPRNRLAVWQAAGGAAIVAITMAASDVLAGSTETSPATGAILEHVPQARLLRVLGKDIQADTGAVIGRVVDLLVDDNGKPCAAIVDFGGFLGVGSRKVAVAWDALRFRLDDRQTAITVDLDRDQIKAAPEYTESHQAVAIVGVPKVEEGR